jgi:hypothetical protein
MDPERDNYADLDLPPPRRWPVAAIISVLLGIGLFAFIVIGCLMATILHGPQFDD